VTDDWFDAFGAPLAELGIRPHDFVEPETVVQIGLPPSRIDVLTDVSGLDDFGAAWADRVTVELRGRLVPFLGRAALIANKRAAARLKDIADLEALGQEASS
jgi:hypothetical protein